MNKNLHSLLKAILLCYFLLSNSQTYSQNLIKNPSFEIRKEGEYKLNKSHELLLDWDYINPIYLEGGGCHYKDSMLLMFTTYYDVREVDNLYKTLIVPKIPFSFVIPYDGYCFVQSNSSYFKRFYQTKLIHPLIKDDYYYFEMYYRLESLSGEANKVPTGWIGPSFSCNDFTNDSLRNELMKGKRKPEIFIDKYDSIALKQWVKYYGVFKAKSNCTYMLLGNHQPFDLKHKNPYEHPKTNFIPNGRSSWQEALIFRIDNVTLLPYSECFRPKYLNVGSIYPVYNISLNTENKINNSGILDDLTQYLISEKGSFLEIYFPENISSNSTYLNLYSDALNSYLKTRGVETNRINLISFDNMSYDVKRILKKDKVSFYFKIKENESKN